MYSPLFSYFIFGHPTHLHSTHRHTVINDIYNPYYHIIHYIILGNIVGGEQPVTNAQITIILRIYSIII